MFLIPLIWICCLIPLAQSFHISEVLQEFKSTKEFTATNSDNWIILFSVPWCNYCKETTRELERSVQRLFKIESPTGVRLIFGKVDCELTPSICSHYGVNSYPSVKFASNGVMKDWPLGLLADDFVKFGYNLMKNPSVTYVNNSADIKRFDSQPKTIKFRLVSNERPVVNAFTEVADQWRMSPEISFGCTQLDLPDTNVNHIVYISDDPSEKPARFIKDLRDARAIDAIVEARSIPLFSEISVGNWDRLLRLQKPLIIVAVYPEQAKTPEHATYLKIAAESASQYKATHLSSWVNAFTYDNFLKKMFGLSDFPELFIYDGQKNVYYMYVPPEGKKQLTKELYDAFVQQVAAGEIEANGQGSGGLGKAKFYFRSFVMMVSEHVLAFSLLFFSCFLVIGLVVFSERGRGDDEDEEYEDDEEREKRLAEEKKRQKEGLKGKTVKAKAD